ncbi:pepsin A-like [Dermacentor silvarum]|uniref:pepsin A-like n=1 Tax=Dermacentor silvarum TaxID=543639 RepID=UPI002101A89A|nr:pepsin A-like [Dermacentor silvarum]XP_049516377.1 pepsin A-like [Dermacentor silvarum]
MKCCAITFFALFSVATGRLSIPLHNDLLRSDPDEPEERFFTEKMEPLNFSEIQYYGLMSVGNPPQTFKVIFDTTSNVTWVPSVGCSRTQCGNRKLYDNRKSSSYSPYGVWVEDPSIAGSGIKGTAARETIEFAGLKFTNQLFVEATVIDPEIYKDVPFEGSVGLKYEPSGTAQSWSGDGHNLRQ